MRLQTSAVDTEMHLNRSAIDTESLLVMRRKLAEASPADGGAPELMRPSDIPRAPSKSSAETTMLSSGDTVAMNFVVIPVGSNPRFGYWLRASDAAEARMLVSLNVPDMAGVTDPGFAQCNPDDTHAPMHGVIFEGSGRSYTITRRTGKPPAAPARR